MYTGEEADGTVQLVGCNTPWNIQSQKWKRNADHDRLTKDDMDTFVASRTSLMTNGVCGYFFCFPLQFCLRSKAVTAPKEQLGAVKKHSGSVPTSNKPVSEAEALTGIYILDPEVCNNDLRKVILCDSSVTVRSISVLHNGVVVADEMECVDYLAATSIYTTNSSWPNNVTKVPRLSADQVVPATVHLDYSGPGRRPTLCPEQKSIQIMKYIVCTFS